ncbi:hypothetical protein [Luteolibacter luteus]|uniref:DUF393 domain-containing protein n=1 Tax=Luteolibacter luteus TaxID=2728835 RepID=A0A858RKC3_9BACT|nr:hypothetical protein [Luteolibacter luteus]QJE96908.1 hypothetical protein HHL09_14310 [Luteolibacter luteus]
MKTLRFYIHPECERCRRLSHFHRRFDWQHRIEHTTRTPATGELKPGQVVAQDIESGEYFQGHRAIQALCRTIPLYRIFLPLFWLKPVRDKLDLQLSGCVNGLCEV